MFYKNDILTVKIVPKHFADKDTANPNNAILFYSGWSVNAAQEYNSGKVWSREHVWAKSHGDFGTTKGAGTDAQRLRPTDISVNSGRNNKVFDIGESLYIDGVDGIKVIGEGFPQ